MAAQEIGLLNGDLYDSFFLSNDPLSSVVFLLFAAQDDMNGRKRIRSSSVWFGQISFVTRDSSSQASKGHVTWSEQENKERLINQILLLPRV